MRLARSLIASLIAALAIPTTALAAARGPVISPAEADGTVTIKTDRYEVRWRDGCMVGLKTLLPGAVDLTAAAPPTDPAKLPNGLGSYHGVPAQAVAAQHHPWGEVAGPFPAQHGPGKGTRLETQNLPGGVRLTYRGLTGDAAAVLVQELTVDAQTGELVIRQEGESPDPGVFGISFSLLNLRPDVELIVPYFGGQRWGPDKDKGRIISIGWTRFWSAGFVMGQVPGSGAGTFMVWAEDPDLRPKFLRRLVTDDTQAVGFESCDEAPYDQARKHKAFTWRFNTYGGNWTEPAARYKGWLTKTFGLVPRAKRPSAWADDVALIWPTSPGEPGLKTMAEAIDPKKVILMDFGMLAGFNRRIPEYQPADTDYAAKVAAAKALGYRVGCYTSVALIDQEAHPTLMKDYGLDYFYTGLLGEKEVPKDWLVYVHPGSAKWRAFYADKMRGLHERLGLDFLYQDVTGGSLGSAGTVEGLNWNGAVLAGEDDIRKAAPRVALGGEYWTEVNACREDFGLATFSAWGGVDGPHWEQMSRPGAPHPVLSYLFSEYCLHWPHQVVLSDTARFHRDQNVNEVTGAIPVWEASADDRSGEARLVLERARLFAEGFRPYFPGGAGAWSGGVASYMKSPAGKVVRYVRRGESTYCYEGEMPAAGDRLRYARVTGVGGVSLPQPVTIDNWIAYGEGGPIGLDPSRWYSVFPADPSPPPPALRLTALPDKAVVTGSRVTDEYALVQFGGGDGAAGEVAYRAARKPLFAATPAGRVETAGESGTVRLAPAGGRWLLFAHAEPAEPAPGAPLPLERWAVRVVSGGHAVRPGSLTEPQPRDIPLEGKTHRAVRVAPPLGGVGSELSLDGFVSLPAGEKLSLRLSAGLFGKIGDGMNFVVRVNGTEVWRQFRPSEDAGWRDAVIPLKQYAGQAVVLSLAVDCGPSGYNTSCDDAAWGDVRLAAE